ncbi:MULTISPECIES: nucleotide exchange factor GrpE [unclassified Fusobacterium]|uniref:nucleotide exchange factor GrpE n=1 Tax=unclassified Fusobacterium TaxID=2648384 RepID=UPI001B8ABB1B|nr:MULTISPECIES: nucleotide exchange factor GrpE [unclassified Fusobacterium]MBR8702073.1 hypothetical protein [Fusobacterium sp. DD45]MBR8711872.1 hypothetical protein [Fusobacterium sp. DD28]MBR8752448.1 hypothetical protein [Fusobacterium sp. DD26]
MLKYENLIKTLIVDYLKKEDLYGKKDIDNWIMDNIITQVLFSNTQGIQGFLNSTERKFSKVETGYFIQKYLRHIGKKEFDIEHVIALLRKFGMNNEERRNQYREKVHALCELLLKAFDGDVEAYKEFVNKYTEELYEHNIEKRYYRRHIPVGILLYLSGDRNNPLNIDKNLAMEIKNIPSMKANSLITDIKNEIGYDLGLRKRKKDSNDLINDVKMLVVESDENDEEEEKIETIETLRLERDQYRSSLKLIEKNMDELLENIKEESESIANEEIRDFFVSLNSDKYGNFLDKIPLTEDTLRDIRKNNLDKGLPQEVKKVLMFIKAIIKFLKDQNITPIKTLNEEFEGTAEDIATMDYKGTEFIDNEKKKLRVIATGYKYKDMIISIPKVEEVE